MNRLANLRVGVQLALLAGNEAVVFANDPFDRSICAGVHAAFLRLSDQEAHRFVLVNEEPERRGNEDAE